MARLAHGDLAGAASRLKRALALYEQWDLTHETVAVLRLLVRAQEELGDIAAAFALHKQLLVAVLRMRDGIAEREDQIVAARYEAERELEAAERGRRQLQQLTRANRRLADERRAMEHLAHTDALTGLANRRHFDAQLARLLVQAELSGDEVSMVLVDIDHFKRVNDRHSHLVGDAVLRALAAEITRHCRVSDLAARIGGEEFVVLLPRTSPVEARAVAERLRTSVASLDLGRLAAGLRVTVSAGVAGLPGAVGLDASPGTATPEHLLAAADAALYDAKRSGRNRVRVCPATDPAGVVPGGVVAGGVVAGGIAPGGGVVAGGSVVAGGVVPGGIAPGGGVVAGGSVAPGGGLVAGGRGPGVAGSVASGAAGAGA
jgi:diguanylate cyclase (GGDEF)-like protein